MIACKEPSTCFVLKAMASHGRHARLRSLCGSNRLQRETAPAGKEGSLCPALHRMTQSGWPKAEWGRFRKQPSRALLLYYLRPDASSWPRKSGTMGTQLTEAVTRVLRFV